MTFEMEIDVVSKCPKTINVGADELRSKINSVI